MMPIKKSMDIVSILGLIIAGQNYYAQLVGGVNLNPTRASSIAFEGFQL